MMATTVQYTLRYGFDIDRNPFYFIQFPSTEHNRGGLETMSVAKCVVT